MPGTKPLTRERALDLLDSLQGGECVEVPPGDDEPEWGVDDLLMLAGACLHLARTHPRYQGAVFEGVRKGETIAAAERYGQVIAAVERDEDIEPATPEVQRVTVVRAQTPDPPPNQVVTVISKKPEGMTDHQRRLAAAEKDREAEAARRAEEEERSKAIFSKPSHVVPRRPLPES